MAKKSNKRDKKYIDILKKHINAGRYVTDYNLMADMKIGNSTFNNWLKKWSEFAELHNQLKHTKIAAIVNSLVDGNMRPQCAKYLLDCFDGIYPESVKRELERKEKELELRLSGDLTDNTAELYVNFSVKEDDRGEEE